MLFFASLGVGMLIAFVQPSNAPVALAYVILSFFPLFFAFQNNLTGVFQTLPYFIYIEIYYRANGRILPYLYCPYVLIGVFVLLLAKKGTKFTIYSRNFVFLFLFAIVEMLNSFNTDDIKVGRGLIIEDILLAISCLWACSTKLSSNQINILLKSMKSAGLWLCGYILTAHVTGHIKYDTSSNFDSTNGLAPVQISAYLGFLSFLFFLSIVNDTDKKNILLNMIFLLISSTLMVLSFSRGGVYFIGVLVTIYFILNAKKMSSYYMIILVVPLVSIVYYIATNETNGQVGERFAKEGTSGRDDLVKLGFDFFLNHPVTGIGTGNFNTEIVNEGLYYTESGVHNEYIRAIAEDGFLGIFTYWLFYISLFYDIVRARGVKREYALYFFVLFCLIIVHNGLKIGLQCMILTLVITILNSSNDTRPQIA